MGTVSITDLLGNTKVTINDNSLSSNNNLSINNITINSLSSNLGKIILDNSIVHLDNLTIPYNQFSWDNISINPTTNKFQLNTNINIGNISDNLSSNPSINISNINSNPSNNTNIDTSGINNYNPTNERLKISISKDDEHKLSIELPKIENIPVKSLYDYGNKLNDFLYESTNVLADIGNNSFSGQTAYSLKGLITPVLNDLTNTINLVSNKASNWIDTNISNTIGLGITLAGQGVSIANNVINVFFKNSGINLGQTVSNALNKAKTWLFGDQSFINQDEQKYSKYNIAKDMAKDTVNFFGTFINLGKNAKNMSNEEIVKAGLMNTLNLSVSILNTISKLSHKNTSLNDRVNNARKNLGKNNYLQLGLIDEDGKITDIIDDDRVNNAKKNLDNNSYDIKNPFTGDIEDTKKTIYNEDGSISGAMFSESKLQQLQPSSKTLDDFDSNIKKVLLNRTRLDNMYNTYNTNTNWYIEIVPYNRFAKGYDNENNPIYSQMKKSNEELVEEYTTSHPNVRKDKISDNIYNNYINDYNDKYNNQFSNETPPDLYKAYGLDNSTRYKLPIESYQIINDASNVLSYDMYPFDSTKIFTNSIIQKAENISISLIDYFPIYNSNKNSDGSALERWKRAYLKYVNVNIKNNIVTEYEYKISKDENSVATNTSESYLDTTISSAARFYQDCCYLIILYKYNGRYDKENYIYSIERFIGLPYAVKSNRQGTSTNDGVIIDQLNFYVVGRL